MSSECGLNGDVSNSTLLHGAGSCTACGRKSECKCDRCGDFYCSKECQLKDWPAHRFICFPMPKLVKIGQVSDTKNFPKFNVNQNNSPKSGTSSECAKSQINMKLPSGSCVFLTAFKSSNRCFIHSTNPSSVAEREKVLNEIHEFGKTASAIPSKPKNNFHALALRNEKWCRVQIIKFKDNVCTAIFTDFGEKSNIFLKELRNSNTSINNLPCSSRMVQLKDVNFSSDQKLLNLLTQFTNKEYKIEYDGKQESVELFKWGTSISLNALIQELASKQNNNDMDNKSTVSTLANVDAKKGSGNFANKRDNSDGKTCKINQATSQSKKEVSQPKNGVDAKPQNTRKSSELLQTQKRCLSAPFEIIPLTAQYTGSKVLIMDNSFLESGFIGCLIDKYCENLKAVTEYLNKYDAGHEPYKPQYKEFCLAKFDDIWYRARVEEVLSDDKFLVVYIDFTNENELSSESIRPYPSSLDYPCYTTLCGIDGLPADISKELKEWLEGELKSFTTFTIDDILTSGGICYLKSNDLLKKLHNSKLI